MYKIKHTGEQVDRLLKDVFDSTLQTKDIDVTENGVIEVTPDEGYLGLAKVNVNVEVPTEGGGSSVEADDLLYYMDGTLSWNEGFVVNLNTGELVFSDDYHRDKYSWYYSIDGNKISIRTLGYSIKYGILRLPSVEIVKDGQTKTMFPGIISSMDYSNITLPITKIGKWEFNQL